MSHCSSWHEDSFCKYCKKRRKYLVKGTGYEEVSHIKRLRAGCFQENLDAREGVCHIRSCLFFLTLALPSVSVLFFSSPNTT